MTSQMSLSVAAGGEGTKPGCVNLLLKMIKVLLSYVQAFFPEVLNPVLQ